MRILFYPVGGLANRMRAIDSAVNFSERHKCRLDIFWIRDKGLNCEFKAIWEPIPFLHDVNGRLARLFFYLHRRSHIFTSIVETLERLHILMVFVDEYRGKYEPIYNYVKNDKIINYRFLIIKTCEDFYPSLSFRCDLFQLQSQIKERVVKETELFDNNTIGVHIRRKDHAISIENSPLELFEERMSFEIKECSRVSFYIASDDQDIKDYFLKSIKFKGILFTSKGNLTRNSKAGIIQSIVEFYALSRTKKIVGSYWSSFSALAAKLTNKELIVIRK